MAVRAAALVTTTALVASGLTVSGQSASAATGSAGLEASDAVPPVPVLTDVVDTSALGGTVSDVALTDEAIFVEVTDGGVASVRWRPRSGGDWSSVWGGVELTGDLLAAESAVVHLGQGDHELLVWSDDRDGDGTPGGSREVPAGTVLGHGGLYVWALDADGNVDAQLVESSSAVVQGPTPQGHDFGAVGSTLVWSNQFQNGAVTLVGSDMATGRRTSVIVDCGSAGGWLADAGERVTLGRCADGALHVIDRGAVHRPFLLAVGLAPSEIFHGDGFAVATPEATGELTAIPLYGGGSRGTLGPAKAADMDDAAAGIVLLDDAGAVRLADLSGFAGRLLSAPIDTTPPWAYVSTDGSFSHSRAYWLGADGYDRDSAEFYASGVARTEARSRTKARGATTFGSWSTPRIVPTSNTMTGDPGSTTCWQARATDNAGNTSVWTTEQCVRIDGTAPAVTMTSKPSSTKATGTTTPVKFAWKATDDGTVASYDVRYRRTPLGKSVAAWTYPADGKAITTASYTVGTPKTVTVCVSVRARDKAGNVSGWSGARCTYVDGTAPKMTSMTVQRWLPPFVGDGLIVWRPTFRYAATDEKGVTGYERQTRGAYRGGLGSPATYPWTTKTSFTAQLEVAHEECMRVRAKDAAGNVSAWSYWHCTNAPLDGEFSWATSYNYLGPDTGTPRATWNEKVIPTSMNHNSRSDYSYTARYIRMRVLTGPTQGKMKVYLGSSYLGTVDAHRPTWAWRDITVGSSTSRRGLVRFIGTTKAPVYTHHLYLVR